MADKKSNKIEREYIIPLRTYWKRVPRYKRVNRAIKGIKEFLVRHMKVRDRDLSKIKLDKYLNEAMWSRGIKKPPVKIKVKVVKEGDIVHVKLTEMSDKLKFKKAREEKREQKALEAVEGKKKTLKEILAKKPEESKEADTLKGTSEKKEETLITSRSQEGTSKKKEDEKEKKLAVVEAGQQMEKDAAKKVKHQVGGKTKQPKHQVRKALAK